MRKRLTLIALASAVALALVLIAMPDTVFAQSGVHIVQRGETLSSIALRYGTTQAAIMSANRMTNPNFVWVGQRLVIPGGGASRAAPAPAPAATGYHIVRPGETLAMIAARYGTTWPQLVALNNLRNANHIYAGQRLRVTGSAAAPAQRPSAPVSTGGTYVVQRGDGLAAIAQRHGVSLNALMQANGIRNANFIYVGQRLVIPSGGASRPVVSPPQTAPSSGVGGKRIEINLSQQRLTAWEGNRIVLSTAISSGRSRTPTVTGNFQVIRKVQMQDMSGPGYYVRNVPWVMYFYGAYAIHGAYWHNNFGTPMSAGCVNMTPEEARWLYNWAPMGTPVRVTY